MPIVSIPRLELQDWLHGVAEIASAVNQPVSLPALLNLVAETACRLMGFDFCGVLLADADRSALLIEGSHGLSAEYIANVNAQHPIVLREGETQAPSSRAFLTHRPVQVIDTGSDPAFEPWGLGARAQGFTSMIAVPLLVSGSALGTLNCYTTRSHEFAEDEVELLTTLANQAAVAIATTRMRAAEARTIADLRDLNTSLEEQHGLLRQGEAIHQRLTDVALREGGVAGVAEALCELLARPVLVEDASGRPLASVPVDGVTLDVPDDEQQDALRAVLVQAGVTGALVDVPDWQGAVTPGPRMAAPVQLDGEVVARIWLPGRVADLAPLDHRAVEHAATVLALELLRMRTALEVEWRMAGELVTDLITANPAARATLVPRAERMGHDLGQPHIALVARADADIEDVVPRILSTVRAVASPVRPRPLVAQTGAYVVALWPRTGSTGATAAVADKIRTAFRRAGGRGTLSVAVSPLCRSLEEYGRAFRLSRGAVELARLRGRTDTTVTLADLGPLGLLLQLEHIEELVAFTDRVLGPLRTYDEKRGTSLTQTLDAYLRHNLNTAETAAELHVHPNTVGLRVRRAEELLRMSVADTDSVIHVGLALMADQVVQIAGATTSG
ncbi:GAF domain-containing protein [Georgenia thermotolerans]|uniref:GAF domain-containing protein n=1 Tax=Georgenia thermotolerans TaxID=527326 RepID=A0A7J5UUG2_9MICO|nr:GAF domain-containing protein [Georgenia thermotolerans]